MPLVQKRLNDLKAVIVDSEPESIGEDDDDDVLHESAFNVAAESSAAGPLNPTTLPQDDQPRPSTSMPQPGPSISTPLIQNNLPQDDQPGPSTASCTSTNMSPMRSSTVPKVQCPLCFGTYPIDEVESHADGCSGAFGLVEENSVDRPIEYATLDAKIIGINDENTSLARCIQELKDGGLKTDMEMVRITVRRKMLWQDFKRTRNRYYQPDRLLKITFAGEPAVDDGGPKREFFSGTIHV